MRKLIVKHFALGYLIKIFGQEFGALRASRIIYPLFVLSGISTLIFGYNVLSLILWGLTAISVFFGFVYFRFYPVKWDELDDFQKYQYGALMPLTMTQRKEWNELKIKYEL